MGDGVRGGFRLVLFCSEMGRGGVGEVVWGLGITIGLGLRGME